MGHPISLGSDPDRLFDPLLEPSYHSFFGAGLPVHKPGKRTPGPRLIYELQSRPAIRRAYLEWLNTVVGGVAFGMIATKTARRPER